MRLFSQFLNLKIPDKMRIFKDKTNQNLLLKKPFFLIWEENDKKRKNW